MVLVLLQVHVHQQGLAAAGGAPQAQLVESKRCVGTFIQQRELL
ncbi:MAG: hypothetical protein DDT34_01994 [Firmicutes bacterium]|nr:hypothetical protein [Bacillota bacterium]